VSFFDEVDDPPRAARAAQRRTRPSGRGRPPGDQQAIQTRRTVAVVAVVVVVILMGLLIKSCQDSARISGLKDYNNSVSTLIGESDSIGSSVFGALNAIGSSGGAQAVEGTLATLLGKARQRLAEAEALSVPGEMTAAQQNVVLSLKMRRDGIDVIANEIQPATATTASRDAITKIASGMARFYASDVVYKAYAVPEIAGALNGAGITVGGSNGEVINGGQFLSDLGWLQTSYVAAKLGAQVPGSPQLSVSLTQAAVGTNTMVSGVTNHVQASPPPTFTLSVTNTSHRTETGIPCSVSLNGANITGTSTITSLAAGQSTTCDVTLPSSPSKQVWQITALVGTSANAKNSLNFPVQFL
jgi:hypothetical protein